MAKFIDKAYQEKSEAGPGAALTAAFEMAETEWIDRAKNKSLTDGAEVMAALFVHALNSAGQPCVQLHIGGTGTCVPLLCSSEGVATRVMEPHVTKKEKTKLIEVGFDVNAAGEAKCTFGDAGFNKLTTIYKLPACRLIGGRPFKTVKALQKGAVSAKPDVKQAKEW
jgi:hypothetical protein